jgi:hypothetical protein
MWWNGGVTKTLCDWTKKEIEKRHEELCAIVAEPRHVCQKCARCAHFPRHLCKPKRMSARREENGKAGE